MKATNHAYGHDYNNKHMANGGLRQSQQRVVDLDEENNLQRQTSSPMQQSIPRYKNQVGHLLQHCDCELSTVIGKHHEDMAGNATTQSLQ